MRRFRRFLSPATSKHSNSPPPTPRSSTSQIEPIKKEIVESDSKAKNLRVLAAPATSIALSVGSPSPDTSNGPPPTPGPSSSPIEPIKKEIVRSDSKTKNHRVPADSTTSITSSVGSPSPDPSNGPPPTPGPSSSPIEPAKKEIVRSDSKTKNPRVLADSTTSIALSVGSPSLDPLGDPPPTLGPSSSSIEPAKKEIVRSDSKTKNPRVPADSTASIASSVGSSSLDPSDTGADESQFPEESGWRTAYGAARMAVEIANESSDMFLPLKAVVGTLAVLIKNYDQTAANAKQMKEIEDRVQSLTEVLTFPVANQDSMEKARRKALQKKLVGIITKLGSLSEQHKLSKFLKNADHANTLNGFVQDLKDAITDYQTSIQQNIYENTKKIIKDARNLTEAAVCELLERLNPVDAGHKAVYHHDTCLQGTRVSVLDVITRWAKDPQDSHVFWLNGLAGTGKSTIAQTFAEIVANDGTLGASFFCSRDYLDRKELKNIFPTLSYQLACRYPAFRDQIIRAIERDPYVARGSLISQLEDLVVNPLSSTGISCVIVVDALDECVDDQPASAMLSVLARFVKQLPSVKFFITGRPETRIRTGFRLPLLEPFTQTFLLHEVKPSSVDEDIRLYLQEKLTAVAKRRSDLDLTDPWPCNEDLTALTKKSSGLFIFASTLTKFIESEHHEPGERLQLIVTLPDSTVYEGREGIDLLYAQVLKHAFSDIEEATVFENLKRVLGAVILAFNPLSRAQIAGILKIKPSLIATILRHLHSVLLIPKEDSKEIRVFHKSFPDFLQDPDRCPGSHFLVNPPLHHADMAFGCLGLLRKLNPNPCGLPDFVMNRDVADVPELLERKVGGALRYACGYWAMHVRSSGTDSGVVRLASSVTKFFMINFLPWVEIMSLENRLEGVIYSIQSLFEWIDTVGNFSSRLYDLAEDCLRFTMCFFHPIQQSTSHMYHSALPLSPTSSLIRSRFSRENTRITGCFGTLDKWGPVLRTIQGTQGDFSCVTTIGHTSTARIAAACGDGTVGIYDSVTGVLRLSLNPPNPIQAIAGSPDGSALFCTHRENPSVTIWDIQTGGLIHTLPPKGEARHPIQSTIISPDGSVLFSTHRDRPSVIVWDIRTGEPIHTFVLKGEAKDTAISLGGRYLACSFHDGTLNVWEVANKLGGPAFDRGSPIACLCWLASEEHLVVASETSVHIWDVTARTVLHAFSMEDPIRDVIYSKNHRRLAVAAGSGVESAITTINPQSGTSSGPHRVQGRVSCFAFSQAADKLVCAMESQGLQSFNISTQRWEELDHPATITSVSTLSNGIVVANAAGFGIQLLRPDEGCAPSRQLTTPMLTTRPLDEDRIIAIIPVSRDCVILLESTTMRQLLKIPAQENLPIPTDRAAVICASLKTEVAVHCFEEGNRANLQLWKFGYEDPVWSVKVGELPSIGGISPAGVHLVTFHVTHDQTYICIWSVKDGRLLARLPLDQPCPTSPLGIVFVSEDQFYSYHDTYRIPYNITVASSKSHGPNHSIIRGGQLPLVGEAQERRYCVDESHEWVISGSQRICWIPPGYIGSAQASHCWAGSSLFMAGHDGTLKVLTFRK